MYGSGINPLHRPASRQTNYAPSRLSAHLPGATRMRTPNMSDEVMSTGSGNNVAEAGDNVGEDDPRQLEFQERYRRTEQRLLAALGDGSSTTAVSNDNTAPANAPVASTAAEVAPPVTAPPKKAARTIDEDDYGDDDDDDDDDDNDDASPLKLKSAAAAINASVIDSSKLKVPALPHKPSVERSNTTSSDQTRSSDDIRKKLEQDRKTIEDAARRSFNTLFYTLETDRDAMLEQQKLDELDRQVENEMSGQGQSTRADPAANPQPGILGTTNLGGSISLTLKHLIAKIDQKRDMVKASDSQLRQLINDVRRGRSKWASDDKVGQEELYNGLEKVLMELKASEHAHPFLQKVNKREAPDYYSIIKHPMDIGTMMKKLKNYQYRSKKEFVDDLMLIWSNCLKYNSEPSHYLRKKALHMKKETERLVPLIPDIVVRDRAEVDAEERARNADLGDLDDSEDEEPIMASRGRKAPSKGGKGASSARKGAPSALEGTPGAEQKPSVPSLPSGTSNLKNEFLRADSDVPMENGFSTPPPGSLTPLGANGVPGSGAPPSQADVSELDGTAGSVTGMLIGTADDPELDDLEYKTWKQITKKDRAAIAAERHRLFRPDGSLNVEEPAILRSRAGMRRWMRRRKQLMEDSNGTTSTETEAAEATQPSAGETLAEGIEEEQDRDVPDYYDPVSAIPDLPERLKWVEDSEGNLVDQSEEFLRILPKGYFTSPDSSLARKMDANMRQMQNTRKICSKIGIVKQMQLQSQMYQNQFQKYDPQPFVEADVDPMIVSDDGPVMARGTVRSALQRSIAKIFYHAGFEETQPTALDAVTDIASDFFANIVRTYTVYTQAPKVREEPQAASGKALKWRSRFTKEEAILHTLHENGVDLEALESYAKEDIDRLGSKLDTMHERYKAHLAELLRPALNSDAGPDGSGAFADDSEQFVGGDFAEDIGEDFFGFKELGLDQEFGLASLSVPLHLLQNRMHNAYAAQNANAASTSGIILEQPPPFEPVTSRNVTQEIGLVQDFFLQKIRESGNDRALEDEELPIKQRFPKPRLPPTGKITSPRKRPLKEQQQAARKKRKMEEGKEDANSAATMNGAVKPLAKPIGKLKFDVPLAKEVLEPEKDDASATGMMSPESM